MQNIKYIYILSSFLLLSCGENFFDSIVEIEVPEHESNLAITAHLTNLDQASLVHVTRTLGILDNQDPLPVTDAKVELYSENQLIQTYTYMELFEEPGQNGNSLIRDLYVVEEPKELTTDKTYELRVSTPTFGKIVANQPLMSATPIISGTYEEDGIVDIYGDRGNEISIKFKDRANEKNFYAVQARLKAGADNEADGLSLYLSPVDPITEEGISTLLLSDVTFDGKEYELKMAFFDYVESLDEIEVVLYTITADRYLYETTLINYEENNGNPFAEPVIIHENVSQGNGIFTMSTGSVFRIKK